MRPYRAVYDISVTLGTESIVHPGDTPYSRELTHSTGDGDAYNLSRMEMSTHSGTHIDLPSHFVHNGKSVDQYSVGDFILPAQVIHIQDGYEIRPDELESHDIDQGGAVLFKTENSLSGRNRSGRFTDRYVYLSEQAARYCMARKVRLVGIDYISIERFDDKGYSVHHQLLGNDILILEGIDLKGVSPGRYTLLCLPLKIHGAEASPVRAVLLA